MSEVWRKFTKQHAFDLLCRYCRNENLFLRFMHWGTQRSEADQKLMPVGLKGLIITQQRSCMSTASLYPGFILTRYLKCVDASWKASKISYISSGMSPLKELANQFFGNFCIFKFMNLRFVVVPGRTECIYYSNWYLHITLKKNKH